MGIWLQRPGPSSGADALTWSLGSLHSFRCLLFLPIPQHTTPPAESPPWDQKAPLSLRAAAQQLGRSCNPL